MLHMLLKKEVFHYETTHTAYLRVMTPHHQIPQQQRHSFSALLTAHLYSFNTIPCLGTAFLCWAKVITDLSTLQPQAENDTLSP